MAEAEGHLLKALALDPDHHIAHVALGFCYLAGSFWGDPDRGSQIEKAFAHARKLQEIAPDDAQTYRLLTRIYSAKGMFDEAWDCAERALRINPHDGDIIGNRGVYHLFDGDFGQAVEWLDKVLELHADTPHTMDIMRYWKALALFGARDYDACAALLTSITGLNFLKAELLAPCYARLGDTARAKAKTAELLQMHPDVHLSHVGLWKAFRHEADRQHLLEAMREAGFPE